jgi:hypothetical protein
LIPVDLNRVDLDWCMTILKKMKDVLESPNYTQEEKLHALNWYVKQALKVEPDYYSSVSISQTRE